MALDSLSSIQIIRYVCDVYVDLLRNFKRLDDLITRFELKKYEGLVTGFGMSTNNISNSSDVEIILVGGNDTRNISLLLFINNQLAFYINTIDYLTSYSKLHKNSLDINYQLDGVRLYFHEPKGQNNEEALVPSIFNEDVHFQKSLIYPLPSYEDSLVLINLHKDLAAYAAKHRINIIINPELSQCNIDNIDFNTKFLEILKMLHC